MTDQEIIQGLIQKSNVVTQEFFFERCRPLFCKIISHVFTYEVDYDEFVNELYLYLMEDDAQKLRNFEYRCSVYQWLKVLAIRFFIKKRDRMIEDSSNVHLYERLKIVKSEEMVEMTKLDLQRLFQLMPSQRYAFVIRRLVIEDDDPQDLAAAYALVNDRDHMYSNLHAAIKANVLYKFDILEWPVFERYAKEERFKKIADVKDLMGFEKKIENF